LVVELGLDGQRLLVEVPDLGVSTIWSLDDHVSVVDEIKVSVLSQCRDDMEWSFDIESILFIELSFSWFSLPFISIDDVPLLVDSAMLVVDNDVSVFSIMTSINIKDLSVLIDNESTVNSPHLPPSRGDSAGQSDVA
jgi:hypothetical protein